MITTKKIDPRPYQQKAAAAIHREWDAGNKKTLVVMPTGTGKTIVFASIVNDQVEKGEHVLILAHREELLQQASDKLKMVTGLETALEKAQNSALDSDKMVVVASVQTLSKQNRLMKYPRDYFGAIIIDEAHHTAAKTYKGILEHFIDAKVLGVTATPDRSDMKSLSDIFDSLAFEYKLPDAIREGYLCKINTKTIPVEVDISKVHINAGDFSAQDLGNVLDLYLDTIADAIVRLYYTAFDILEKGEIITHRDKEREELLAIRNGKYLREDGPYAPEFFEFVDALEKKFQDDVRKTSLPAKPDFGKIEEFLVEINKEYLRRVM